MFSAADDIAALDGGVEILAPSLQPDTIRHDAAHVFDLIARRWRLRLAEELKTVGLTPPQFAALEVLCAHPDGLSQIELADLVGVEGATLVRTIDSLVRTDLATRDPSRIDRRVNLIRPTPSAVAVMADAHVRMNALQDVFLVDFDDRQRSVLCDTLHQILARLSN